MSYEDDDVGYVSLSTCTATSTPYLSVGKTVAWTPPRGVTAKMLCAGYDAYQNSRDICNVNKTVCDVFMAMFKAKRK